MQVFMNSMLHLSTFNLSTHYSINGSHCRTLRAKSSMKSAAT